MIDSYRKEYAGFNSDLMREFYLYNSGQKDQYILQPIYERYSNLFDPESVNCLIRELEGTSTHFDTQRTSIRHLLSFAINSQLEAGVKELTEAISLLEFSAKLSYGEKDLTFQDSAVAVGTESDASTRRRLYEWRTSVVSSSNSLRVERLSKLHESARAVPSVGANGNRGEATEEFSLPGSGGQAPARARSRYPSYLRLCEDLYEVDYSAVARNAETLLTETETVFENRLRDALRRDLHIELEEATRADAIYFAHLSRYDSEFSASGIMRVYRATMEGLGIHPDSQTNIKVDSESRPAKNARAFCAPVQVPQEIYLVYRPYGGQTDYNALLHEAGHTQHYAWTSPSLQPEFKYSGDLALTETYAFLFNHLTADESWLLEVLGFENSQAFRISMFLIRLLAVRRYAAKLLYEMSLHSGDDLSEAPRLYSDLQTKATRFRTGEEEFLYDLDDSFYSAAYLRAWAFEGILREHLKQKFGKRWWSERRAGRLLKEIWETGERYTADQIASQLGIGPISFDLLIDEFQGALK